MTVCIRCNSDTHRLAPPTQNGFPLPAAADPDLVAHGRKVERLVVSNAAMPLCGSAMAPLMAGSGWIVLKNTQTST